MKTQYRIRPAVEADIEAINEIYNYYVLHSSCTYQEEPEPIEGRRAWFAAHGEKHPVIVTELADDAGHSHGKIVGWGSLSAYHKRAAYRHTVENSIYVDRDYLHRGIGAALLKELIQLARNIGHHSIIAVIDAEQRPSVALHEKFGFDTVGRFKEVGYKFERWLDVIYMELIIT